RLHLSAVSIGSDNTTTTELTLSPALYQSLYSADLTHKTLPALRASSEYGAGFSDEKILFAPTSVFIIAHNIAQTRQVFLNTFFRAVIRGVVILDSDKLFWQVLLPDHTAWIIMRELIAHGTSQALRALIVPIAQVRRYMPTFPASKIFLCGSDCLHD